MAKKAVSLLRAAEDEQVDCHKAYNALLSLWGYFEEAAEEDFKALMKKENVVEEEARRIANKIKAGMKTAAQKALTSLEKSETWKFFRSVGRLDPPQVRYLSEKRLEFANARGLGEDSPDIAAEWRVYLKTAQELKSSDRDFAPFLYQQERPGADFDVLAFWVGMEELTSTLISIVLKYLSISINSVATERWFSHYGVSVPHKRHSLREENTKHPLMLSYNSYLKL